MEKLYQGQIEHGDQPPFDAGFPLVHPVLDVLSDNLNAPGLCMSGSGGGMDREDMNKKDMEGMNRRAFLKWLAVGGLTVAIGLYNREEIINSGDSMSSVSAENSPPRGDLLKNPEDDTIGSVYYISAGGENGNNFLRASVADNLKAMRQAVEAEFGGGSVLFVGDEGRTSGFYDPETGRGDINLVPETFERRGVVYNLVPEETQLRAVVYQGESSNRRLVLSTEFETTFSPTAAGWVLTPEGQFKLIFLDGEGRPVVSGSFVDHVLYLIPTGGSAGVDSEGRSVIYDRKGNPLTVYNPETGRRESVNWTRDESRISPVGLEERGIPDPTEGIIGPNSRLTTYFKVTENGGVEWRRTEGDGLLATWDGDEWVIYGWNAPYPTR